MLATFSVNNINDAGMDSLRQAILDANSQGGTDTIVFDQALFGSAQTISLASALPTITESVTITGPGKDLLTLDAGNGTDNLPGTGDGYRLLDIDDGNASNVLNIAVQGLTLTGGDVSGSGGAIYTHENLTVTNSVISANATGPGSLGAASENDRRGGSGGGIFSNGGDLTIIGSTISGNSTGAGGDGVGSQIGGEGGNGGGISADGGDLAIINSTISGNSTGAGGFGGPTGDGGYAGDGGGIYTVTSNVEISGSTISGNFTGEGREGAPGQNGGYGGNGGGLYSIVEYNDSVEISNSTITGNSTGEGGDDNDGNGGGIYINGGDLVIFNTIIAANLASGFSADLLAGSETSTIEYSLIGDGSQVTGGTGNQLGTSLAPLDPQLGPLANNGGPTQTHALLPSSPAIDACDPNIPFNANEFDQRGTPFVRVEDGNLLADIVIDIGAYEVQAPPSADFDQDNDVDGADFLTWQRNVGTTSGALLADGNSDDDEDVDASDLAVWESSFGTSQPALQTLRTEPFSATAGFFAPLSVATGLTLSVAINSESGRQEPAGFEPLTTEIPTRAVAELTSLPIERETSSNSLKFSTKGTETPKDIVFSLDDDFVARPL